MKRCLTPGTTVAHESAGSHAGSRLSVGVGAGGQENTNYELEGRPVGRAERRMQWRFRSLRVRTIHVSAVLEEEFAQPPVPKESGALQVDRRGDRVEALTVGEEEAH